jgi:hypothetical protein
MPDPIIDPAEEAALKQPLVDAANSWASCARDNGAVQIKDAVLTLDNFETTPAVTLGSITVEEFEALIKVCVPLGPDRDLANPRQLGPDGLAHTDPRIDFGLPATDPHRLQLQAALDAHIAGLFEQAQPTGASAED